MIAILVTVGVLVGITNEVGYNNNDTRKICSFYHNDCAVDPNAGDPAEELGRIPPVEFHPVEGSASTTRRSIMPTNDFSSFTTRAAFRPQGPSTGATVQAASMTSVIDREYRPVSITLPSRRVEPIAHPRAAVVPSVEKGVAASTAMQPVTHDTVRPRLLAIRHLCREVLGTDPIVLQTALAAFAANMHFEGVPVWIIFVGPPSSGRSMIIKPLQGRPGAVTLGRLTPAGLLSGTPRRDCSPDSTGGALRSVGDRGVLLVSEMSGYLGNGRQKNDLMATFREIFDGSWSRTVGTDGGNILEWTGHAGFIGAATTAIDSASSVRAEMGERFLYLRFRPTATDSLERGLCSLGNSLAARDQSLHNAVVSLLELVPEGIQPYFPPSGNLIYCIASLATVMAQLRTPVARDEERALVSIPSPEQSPRLAQQLYSLFRGYKLIGFTDREAWQGIQRIARDTMPPMMLLVFDQLLHHLGDAITKPDISVAIGRGRADKTVERILEELKALEIAVDLDGRRTRGLWTLTPETAARCRIAFCEAFPEPSPEEIAAIIGCDAPVPLLPEVSTAEAEAAPLVAEADVTPPDDDGGGGGRPPLHRSPLIVSSPEYDYDHALPAEIADYDLRQPEY